MIPKVLKAQFQVRRPELGNSSPSNQKWTMSLKVLETLRQRHKSVVWKHKQTSLSSNLEIVSEGQSELPSNLPGSEIITNLTNS